MAAGGSKGTGSHDICTFPHGPLPGSGGRSVLSVCKETGGHERNRPQNGIHRRNKAGKRCRPVHLCVAQTHPKAPGEGKGGTGKTNRAEERFRHRFHAGGRTVSYPFRTRKRQTQKSAAARMGRTMDAAGTLESIRTEAGHHGREPQQLFQNRSGRNLHADEGRPHAQRAAQTRV